MASQAMDFQIEPEEGPLSTEERIRARAYEIYLQRDGQDRSALDDWIQAETEILSPPDEG